jgi:hypothetical protein
MYTHSRARAAAVAAVIAGFALSVLGASSVCLASNSASDAAAWQGGWGSAKGWWGPGWWGTGQFVDVLPSGYQSFWWQGKPYYFGDSTFYAWNGDVGKYEQVTPPIGFNQPPSQLVTMSQGIPKLSARLFVYPEAGQTSADQARDEAECHKLASAKEAPPAAPTPPPSPPPTARRGRRPGGRRGGPSAAPEPASSIDTLNLQHAVLSAEAACLEKKHYSVR